MFNILVLMAGGLLVTADLTAKSWPGGNIFSQGWWLDSWLIMAIAAGYGLIELVRKKRWVSIVSLAVFLGVFGSQVNDSQSLSGETATEINCGLNLLSKPELGAKANCLYGYPARQFLPAALPAYLMGRSLLALNLGAMIYLITGSIIWVWGINTKGSKYKNYDWLGGIAILLCLQVFHFLRIGLTYEQSVFPAALTMMVMGLILINQAKNGIVWRGLLTLSLLYCAFAYTPALPVLILGIFDLGWLIYKSYRRKMVEWDTIILAAILIVECFFSWQNRHDLKLTGRDTTARSQGFYLDTVKTTVTHLIMQNQGYRYIAPWGWGVFLITLIALGLGMEGPLGMGVAVWAIAFILLVNLTQGYTMGTIDYRFHRFTAMFPVIFTFFALRLGRWRQKYILIGVWLICLISGGTYSFKYIRERPINWQGALYRMVAPSLDKTSKKEIMAVAAGEKLPGPLYSIKDTFTYFYPGFKQAKIIKTCEELVKSWNDRPNLIIVSADLEPCMWPVQANFTKGKIVNPKNSKEMAWFYLDRNL